jgi:hypothetical protein
MAGTCSFAQMVNGIPFNTIHSEYLQISPDTKKVPLGKLSIAVDFGQDLRDMPDKDNLLRSNTGEVMAFSSIVDVFNFCDKDLGYAYLDVYSVAGYGGGIVYYYILKKKAKQE